MCPPVHNQIIPGMAYIEAPPPICVLNIGNHLRASDSRHRLTEAYKDKDVFPISQKTNEGLIAFAWRELTTSREERLSLLRLSRGAKEEDESQIALLRTQK